MKRDMVTDFLVILFVTSVLVLIWAITSSGAPAPLPRRGNQPRYDIPQTCVMHWGSQRYKTTFAPDGYYHAVCMNNDREYWTGTWELRYEKSNPILTICESHGCVMNQGYIKYDVKLVRSLAHSVDGYVKLKR